MKSFKDMSEQEIEFLSQLQYSFTDYDKWEYLIHIPLKHIPIFDQEIFTKSVDWKQFTFSWIDTPENCAQSYMDMIECSSIDLEPWSSIKKWIWFLTVCDINNIVFKSRHLPEDIMSNALADYSLWD